MICYTYIDVNTFMMSLNSRKLLNKITVNIYNCRQEHNPRLNKATRS